MHYRVSWEEYDKQIRILALTVKERGEKFDLIYTLSRGGLTMAAHLSHLLGIKRVAVDCYPGIPGNMLIIDDVSDSGKTLQAITATRAGLPYKTATLHRKDGTNFEPNYYVKTINEWIVYPWEE